MYDFYIRLFKHPSIRISTVTFIIVFSFILGSHCCGASILISFFFGHFFTSSFFPSFFTWAFAFVYFFDGHFFSGSTFGVFLASFFGNLAFLSFLAFEIGLDLFERLFVFSFYFDFFISSSFCFFAMKFNFIVGAGWPGGSLLKKFVSAIGFGFGFEHGGGDISFFAAFWSESSCFDFFFSVLFSSEIMAACDVLFFDSILAMSSFDFLFSSCFLLASSAFSSSLASFCSYLCFNLSSCSSCFCLSFWSRILIFSSFFYYFSISCWIRSYSFWASLKASRACFSICFLCSRCCCSSWRINSRSYFSFSFSWISNSLLSSMAFSAALISSRSGWILSLAIFTSSGFSRPPGKTCTKLSSVSFVA